MMNIASRCLLMFVPILLAVGCTAGTSESHHENGKQAQATTSATGNSEEAEIQANLAKLDPTDRKLAEAQRYCAVQKDERLGSMGEPFKIMVKDQPVFLCCGGCAKKAKADPDKTLAQVKELKAKTAATAVK